MATKVCKNHPDRSGRYRCAFCGAYLCGECRLARGGKSFCGWRCYFRYRLERSWRRVRLELRKLTRRYRPELRSPVTILALLLAVALLGDVILITRRYGAGPREPGALTVAKRSSVSTFRAGQRKRPKATLLGADLTLKGTVDRRCVVSVVADSVLLAAELVKGGAFQLGPIPASRGLNRFVVTALYADGKLDTLGTFVYTYTPPSLLYLARDFWRGPVQVPAVALTFDGGSDNNVADEILDILREQGVKATFFLTGEFIRRFPDTVRRIVAEGHVVGNHTWSHPHLTTFAENHRQDTRPGVDRQFVQQQLLKTAELFRKVTGRDMAPYWRAPYGEENREIRLWAAEIGYRHVGWTVGKDWHHSMDTLDWVADTTSVAYLSSDQVVQRVLSFGKDDPHGANGAIVLMHLGTNRVRDFPHRRLPEIIDGLRRQGYRLVSIPELLP